jgi:glycine/D-amino acid oxidase-like deaminating enzyme
MNCTGLGAKALFNDEELTPIKGQLSILLPQPEVTYTYMNYMSPDDLYVFPRRDGVLLGGTFERGVWSLEPSPVETERILKGHAKIMSEMRVVSL